MVAYMVGIVMTVAIMLIFDHGQPALLYLVPCVLGSVVIKAALSNQFDKVSHFDEAKLYEIKKD